MDLKEKQLAPGEEMNPEKSDKPEAELYFCSRDGKNKTLVSSITLSKRIKISHDGVTFHSPTNGDELFIGPKESIKIQEKLGADIIFAFDECTPPLADYDYVKN